MSSLFISANKDTLFRYFHKQMILKMFSALILFHEYCKKQ